MAVCGIGQAQRVAEQRRHREPVGDAADEAGLRRGLQQVGPPALREREAGQGQRAHQDEQGGGEGAVTGEVTAGFGVGIDHARGYALSGGGRKARALPRSPPGSAGAGLWLGFRAGLRRRVRCW